MAKKYANRDAYLRARRKARQEARRERELAGGNWQDGNPWTGVTERLWDLPEDAPASPPDSYEPLGEQQWNWVNGDWEFYDQVSEYN